MASRPPLTKYALLSIVAALATMGLKAIAYSITGSVGLLSDALESGVNLAAAILALYVLSVVARPPDEEHTYGHEKAEYFSSGAEGTLILLAAVAVAYQAIGRLLDPRPLQRLNLGLAISLLASSINLGAAQILRRVGDRQRSIALQADAQHLMTDVWTSAAVLLGVGLVSLTGWPILDPVVALLAAVHIAWSGISLLRRSTGGLMDTALPAAQVGRIEGILAQFEGEGARYHALRTRRAGARAFISVHVQVPGHWSVQRGHDLLERVEHDVRQELPSAVVFTHLEPIEDPRSWRDETLDRPLPDSSRPSSD